MSTQGPGDPGGRIVDALGNLFAQVPGAKLLGLGALTVMAVTGGIVIHNLNPGSSQTAATSAAGTSGNSQAQQNGSSTGNVGNGVVTFEITAYNKPPCGVMPIGIESMEPSDADVNPRDAEQASSTAGSCTFILHLKKGTKLTYAIRNPSSNGGWVTPHTWTGPCPGSFHGAVNQFVPAPADVTCTTTLDQSTSLSITFEAVAWQYQNGAWSGWTADFPHCLPAAAWIGPGPQPAGCS